MINQVSYIKVGKKKDNKRLWLEGKRMALCGFERGAKYHTVFDVQKRSLTLELDENGDRQVSGRKRGDKELPIVELCSSSVTQYIEDVLGDAPRVRVAFEARRLTITVHPHDLLQSEREKRLTDNLLQGIIDEATLCAGGGISSYALHEGLNEAGIKAHSEFIVDIEGKYLQSAIDNNPHIDENTRIFEAALEEVETELLGPVDVLNVSLPCTGFSNSGKSKNKIKHGESHEAAGTAVFGLMQILPAVNPSVVISENVPQFKDSATYALIRGTLDKLGYEVHDTVLGREMGAFEDRNRHIMVAVSKGIADKFDLSTIQPSDTPPKKLGDLLDDLPKASELWRTYDYLKSKEERDKAAGKGFSRQLVNEESERIGTIGRGYNKARSTEPFVQHPTDPNKSRLLTVAEHARVKGIPENAVAGQSKTIAHEILGQSVLFPVFKSIGRHIGSFLNEHVAQIKQADCVELETITDELKQLCFTFEQIERLQEEQPESIDDCQDIIEQAQEKYQDITEQISRLPEIESGQAMRM
jgi:DNA (cytosine-5)-methyltransferase 1